MNHQNHYLQTKVMSASPAEQLVMLYDTLLRHADLAEISLSSPLDSFERLQAATSVTRCIDILTELNTSLRHEIQPKLCQVLSNLYLFFTKELSDALSGSRPEKIRAIIPLMQRLSNTWKQAQKLASQPQDQAA